MRTFIYNQLIYPDVAALSLICSDVKSSLPVLSLS